MTKTLFSRALRLACLLTLWAAASLRAQVTPRNIPDLPYVTGGTERQELDLYLPPTPGGAPRPLVLWIHGGGWEAGDRRRCPALPFVQHGYAVASIGYRLSSQAIYPAQIEDCKSAIRWLRAHAREYDLDPQHIGAWGASAGGQLVAMLGTTGHILQFDVGENLDQSSAVQCVIDWYGPTDLLHWGEGPPSPLLDQPNNMISHLLGGTVATHQEAARTASPVDFVNGTSAPFFIMHGTADNIVPLQQSQELDAALRKAGVESKLTLVPGGGHGTGGFGKPENYELMERFLAAHLGTPRVGR